MTPGVEPTHRIAELTLGALKKIGLPASARNYELWYAHIEGKNPALSRDIQIAADSFGKVSQGDADRLYKTHIQHAGLSNDVIELVTKFQSEISGLYDMIEQTGENAVDHRDTLQSLSDQLRQTTEDYPAVGKLLEGVISVAKDMRTENEQLENRLAESVIEISVLQRNVENIQEEAMRDPLTGVANRARFDKALDQQMANATATGAPLSLVMADIDYFKSFNDKWGHQTGDQVLRLVAEVMNANIKGQDVLARYGGEEFAIILPETSAENAQKLADRIRNAIESRRLKKRRTEEDLGVVTISMGVSAFRRADTAESFVERADECLYAAKDAGRNKVVTETDLNGKSAKAEKGAA